MERNRESRRAASSTAAGGSGVSSSSRRSRPKDVSDDERMEEVTDARTWDRHKKERLTAMHGSSLNPRSKRRRHGLPHDSHYPGRTVVTAEEADESTEETEIAASEEEDEPPPPPPALPLLRKPVKSRPHAREDEIVMDIPNVPRKARSSISSSSRYLSISKRQQESVSNDNHHLKSPVTSQTFGNGNASPNFLHKQGKRLKPVGTKVRPVKAPKVSEPCTISDQEAEVAEALFVLARSTPSHSGLLEPRFEARLETNDRTASPAHSPLVTTSDRGHSPSNLHSQGNPSNGYTSHLKETNKIGFEAPKRKRPRVTVKQDEDKVSASVHLVSGASSDSPSRPMHGKLEPGHSSERKHFVPADGHSPSTGLLKDADISHLVPPQHPNNTDMEITSAEHEIIEKSESKVPKEDSESKTEVSDQKSKCSGSSSHVKDVKGIDIKLENEDTANKDLLSRTIDGLHDKDGDSSKIKIDLMAPPMKLISTEDTPEAVIEKPSSNDSSLIPSTISMDTVIRNAEELSKDARGSAKGVESESSHLKQQLSEGKLELKQEPEDPIHGQPKVEMIPSQVQCPKEGDRDKEKESLKSNFKLQKEDTGKVGNSTALSMLPGWIGGLPQMGYYSPGGTPWAAGASIPSSNLDLKTTHPAMQMPHASILPPVTPMKRCATHVYLAHFIFREQKLSQHSMWSAAICRAAPYNLNIPPVNIHDNEKLGAYGDATRKASAPQSGPPYGYSMSQTSGVGVSGGPPAAIVSSFSHGNSTGVIDTAAQAQQYLQAMMQQNGFASFPFPFAGPPGQGAQFFNNPFFPPHLMPPLPQLQTMAQSPGSVPPLQKQQQGISNSSSAPALTAPTQQLHLQLASQSATPQQLQHNHMGIASQCFASRSEKESTGGESLLTPDSRLSAMQRNVSDQGASNLPNLNISPSMMLPKSIHAGLSTSGEKHNNKSHQAVQFPSQHQPSPSPAMQQQQFIQQNNLQMKALDQSISHGYSSMTVPGTNRGSVGPGPLGVVSVASMMASPGHGLLPGSCEDARVHMQQQPSSGSQQQFQRNMNKVTTGENIYSGKDNMEDKKQTLKHVGGIPQLTRVEMEASSSSIQASPTSSGGPQATRMGTPNIGRTTIAPDSRSTRAAGSGQITVVQSQTPKQAISRTKSISGPNLGGPGAGQSVSTYSDNAIPGNFGKYSGTMLPYSAQQIAPPSHSSKQNQTSMLKNPQRASPGPGQQQLANSALTKSQVQQARTNQHAAVSTPPRMLPSASPPVLSSGNLPTTASLPGSKSTVGSASKSPSNGKGSVSTSKTGAPKKSYANGPIVSGNVGPGQSMAVKGTTAQQKNQVTLQGPQFQQQQPLTSVQQQKMTTKNQVYPQLQPQQNQYKQSSYRSQVFLPQHQHQYVQQCPAQQQQQQQQAVSQIPSPMHHYQSSSQDLAVSSQMQQQSHIDAQTGHLQQEVLPIPSSTISTINNNALSLSSSNLNLGTSVIATMSTNSSSGSQLAGNVMPDMTTSGYPTVSTQVNSPHSGSSQYLQPAVVKSDQQKTLPDCTNRDEMNNGRHIPSSPSQTAIALNHLSS